MDELALGELVEEFVQRNSSNRVKCSSAHTILLIHHAALYATLSASSSRNIQAPVKGLRLSICVANADGETEAFEVSG